MSSVSPGFMPKKKKHPFYTIYIHQQDNAEKFNRYIYTNITKRISLCLCCSDGFVAAFSRCQFIIYSARPYEKRSFSFGLFYGLKAPFHAIFLKPILFCFSHLMPTLYKTKPNQTPKRVMQRKKKIGINIQNVTETTTEKEHINPIRFI